MPYRYVPMLRSKSGEVTALEHLPVQARQRLLPIMHLVARPPTTFVQRLAAVWDQEVGIDGLFNLSITGSVQPFTGAIAALRQAGVTALPSVDAADAVPSYVQAVQRLVTTRYPNLIVKAPLRLLPTIETWVRGNGWQPAHVDLVASVGHVPELPEDFGGYVGQRIDTSLPNPSSWRSVTLASSSAPKDYSALAPGRNVIPRLCWRLWQNVRQVVNGFQLDYGDYAIAHPDLSEPPGVAMVRASVSVRYAIDSDWVVLKGRSTTGPSGQTMASQYTRHAQALQAEPQFNRVPGCWGDQRILSIASGQAAGSGSRQSWIEIGVNRHLTLVAHQLP